MILLLGLPHGSNDGTELKIVPKPIPTATVSEDIFEKPLTRLESLSEAAGVTVPVIEGSCGTNPRVLGCYDTVENHITITPSGISKTDEKIVCVLKHEMRHKWQDDNGLIKFDNNGNITNSWWIEWDARENGCR